jgi:hypothetical protein
MPFRAVLQGLLASAPIARGAVFCDFEGERVEAVVRDPELDPYELDLAGATYARAVEQLTAGDEAQLRVVHENAVVWVQPVRDGYYVVLLARRCGADGFLRGPLRDAGDALRALL